MRSTSLGDFFFPFWYFCDSILSIAQATLNIVGRHLPCIGITGMLHLCFQVISDTCLPHVSSSLLCLVLTRPLAWGHCSGLSLVTSRCEAGELGSTLRQLWTWVTQVGPVEVRSPDVWRDICQNWAWGPKGVATVTVTQLLTLPG